MTKPEVIPTNFVVPKSCRHRWIFVAGLTRFEIRGVPSRKQITMEQFNLPLPTDPNDIKTINFPFVAASHLDWMQDSIAHLRRLCQ